MNSNDWLLGRTPSELLEAYDLLRHLPQIDFQGHHYRRSLKAELERRATNLSGFLRRLDASDCVASDD